MVSRHARRPVLVWCACAMLMLLMCSDSVWVTVTATAATQIPMPIKIKVDTITGTTNESQQKEKATPPVVPNAAAPATSTPPPPEAPAAPTVVPVVPTVIPVSIPAPAPAAPPAATSSSIVPAVLATHDPHELEVALSALPPPPPHAEVGIALKSATDAIHSLETEQEKRQEAVSEAEDADAEEEEADEDASDADAAVTHLISPEEAIRLAAEVAAHEAHLAAHITDTLPAHEHAESAAEHASHEHTTHEVHAIAIHDGTHQTSAEHPEPVPLGAPQASAGPATPSSSAASSDLRSTARSLLRRLAAERVAQAQAAVRAALTNKKRKPSQRRGVRRHRGAPILNKVPHYDPSSDHADSGQDLFQVDHSRDDEPDDDPGRDHALLRYAMDQMALESKKKQEEISALLAALKDDHTESQQSNSALDPLAALKELEQMRFKQQQEELKQSAGFNYTLFILLGIGVLCLCIAIPVVWIYWLRTWVSSGDAATAIHYRSINNAAHGDVTVTPDDDFEEDELPVDTPDHRTTRPIRFDQRKKSPAASTPAQASARGKPSKARRARAEYDHPDDDDYDYDDSPRDPSRRAPRLASGPRPRIDDLPDDEEDWTEAASMISPNRR